MSQRSIPTSYPFEFWAKVCALCALGCGVGIVLLRWVYMRDLGIEYARAFYTIQSMITYLVPTLALCFLLALFIALVTVVAFAVFASHAIAGPLFRLQRVGDFLARKTLVGEINLRERDWVKPVAEAINQWTGARRVRYKAMHQWADELDGELRVMKLSAGKGDLAAVRGSIERFTATLDAHRKAS